MVRHTLKILQHLLQDFGSMSRHFGTLCIKGLIFTNKQILNIVPRDNVTAVIVLLSYHVKMWKVLLAYALGVSYNKGEKYH